MGNTPFKLKGWSPFTKKSPAKDDPHTTTDDHAAHGVEEVDIFAYEKELEKQDPKTLTHEQKRILSKYAGRKKKAEEKLER
tara:strand:+ start:863 stop:1105 length:243 start_codon:yes stop_codon:yes gene_type:complete